MKIDKIATQAGFPEMWKKREKIVGDFHILYYYLPSSHMAYWRGYPMNKCIFDTWSMQEIICEKLPDFFIECGTAYGGFTLFIADLFEMIGKGVVITVDIRKDCCVAPEHCRIIKVNGDSVDPGVLKTVKKLVSLGKSVMVDLDSDHSKKHVLKELEAYGKLVTPGQYMICEDTNIPETMEALRIFIKKNRDAWITDDERAFKHLLTFAPEGYLIKK